ncbi:AAA domain-containing protein [Methylobacterium sp. J-026]|uniref:DEAD/DEAH box helicase n=1 Tax=Methylobacterium sp. J-026 TaxID=2836624 RepID=UPI001FBB9C08|nr:AAA domain-containing protein [Methylobacterium sp. J-026]MCJ2138087.1 AAA domain-containing protein [Methylobacterium sp. J-026]
MGGNLESRLRGATDVESGEKYLVRLFPKTGTAIDQDLRRLIDGGLRRIRRVLSSRRAREVLVEVVEIVEDEHEFGIVMLDPGSPLLGSPRQVQARRQSCMTNTGRRNFWQNISRVVEALTHCHDAGIVHGALDESSIFVGDDRSPSYRLGGYEACIHIADDDLPPSEMAFRTSDPVSFRQDLANVAKVVQSVLGHGQLDEPVLTGIERRMLARMSDPPHFQLYDGHVALEELAEVVDELDRLGTSTEGELVLYPVRDVLRSDLPTLASGAIPADDTDAVLLFVADDLLGPDTRAVVDARMVRVVTDLAIYRIEIVDDRIGMIVRGTKRQPHDAVSDAFEVKRRIHLARNRGAAAERVRKLGNGALPWAGLRQAPSVATSDDPPSWHALILLEAFSLLKQQFRAFPIDVLTPPRGRSELVWVAPRSDAEVDARRKRLKLPPSPVALGREMDHDEGRPDWTVSYSDTLGRPRERLPELSLEEIGEVEGRRAYGFRSNEPVPPTQLMFLRPRTDAGTEGAIRRRLQNVVAARANVELLRALDDPATVAMEDALRIVAAPGLPPADLDASKKMAWDAIAAGRSINVVVGPPGVGKTYLVAQLIGSILAGTPSARILISSQNHETLVSIEHELRKVLPQPGKIVVRVQKSDVGADETALRRISCEVLDVVSRSGTSGPLANPHREIREALRPADGAEKTVAERVLRDTDDLLLRSADVTLATTSSPFVEDMIADGEQFDWVFVEEAARANGAELIGALLLGNRRVMIGDHRQLSPFEMQARKKLYEPFRAEELLSDAVERLAPIPDLPPEVDATLKHLKTDGSLLIDVLAAATRLEEPFHSIAEREKEREDAIGRPSSIATTLTEQSRMHPTICRVVSDTFYDGRLVPSDRVKERKTTVGSQAGFPASPIVVLDLPPLGVCRIRSFEKRSKKDLSNPAEASALVNALTGLRPTAGPDDEPPSLVVLATYTGQVKLLERLLTPKVDGEGRLQGFVSPRGDRRFVYTSDSFQGGEADVVLASLVRNNTTAGKRALGFLSNPQRLNVLVSRARQKLLLATSLEFLTHVVDGTDPDKAGGDLGFVRTLVGELREAVGERVNGEAYGATIVAHDERGKSVG